MAAVGLVVILFGLIDVIGSFVGFDLWRDFIGWTDMPELLWQLSGYAEMFVGYFLLNMGGDEEAEEAVISDDDLAAADDD